MKVKSLLFVGVSLLAFPYQSRAQFYTIMRESEDKKQVINKAKSDKIDEDYFYAYQDSMKVSSKERDAKMDFTDFFSTAEGHEISIEKDVPVFVNVKDSMLFGLIKERMDVCLPLDFISVTSRYGFRQDPFKKCSTFHDKIAYVRFGTRPPKELNINNLYQALDKYGVAFPKIVVAQALLETGYFTSNVCLNYNNLFGLRKPNDGSYYLFNNWEESVKAYKDYVQYKYKGGDYFRFLQRIGYAEDSNYLYKVKSISNSL